MRTEQILQGYSEAEQQRIAQISHELGIAEDDPMFKLMATLGRNEETMIDLQARMEAMVEAWAVMIDQKLESTSKAAQSMHYTVVSKAVRDEMKHVTPSTLNSSFKGLGWWKLWSISGICTGVMAVGALLGSLTTWNVVSNLGGTQSVVVSANEMKILQWAKSSEGKQMYQLLLSNQSAVAACQQENRLQGYCLIQLKKTKPKK
ncbi:hypothetical protein A4S05_14940 [Nostoc sp. KVJ20]|uniref:DUF6753 family protein n=1 Tax=Nostoc sp. KVJ20 TaxID=457944 RepID=UPI00083D6EA8|nr:DUF6753 family protein [Nostoc sp. KVJ20]ODG97193.1 hypothetical protein A4S05_14940 [Nostoc sp. KVJ20]